MMKKTDKYIKEEDLVEGSLYRINGRNSKYGLYTGGGMFILAREKFETTFLCEELHIDRDGTAIPLENLEKSPWNKPFRAPNKDEVLKWLLRKENEYDSPMPAA